MRKIKLSEQQVRKLLSLKEAIATGSNPQQLTISMPQNNLTAAQKQNPALAVKATQDAAKKQGIPDTVDTTARANVNGENVEFVAKTAGDQMNATSTTNESIIITNKQLNSMRLRKLKENSTIITLKDLLK